MSTDASGLDLACPDHVTTPAEFVAALRRLREQARLTYRQLEVKAQAAGHRLPRSTIAAALSRSRVPAEQTIVAFVRACGGDGAAVRAWLAVRRRVSPFTSRSLVAAGDSSRDADLAATVSAWAQARWHDTARARPAEDLAVAVEKWLANRLRSVPSGFDNPSGYAQGRLAQAAATSPSGRWVGLHRRPPRRRLLRRG